MTMEKRKIEVVRIGEKSASGLNDRVSIEFSPHELEAMKQIFMTRAINAETYIGQTEEREMAEVFDEANRMRKEKRRKGDAKAGYAV